MRAIVTTFLGVLLLGGCASINSTSRKENQRVEVIMHKVRTDLEELKHDLSTQRMEVHLLEGKLLNQEDKLSAIREDEATGAESSEQQRLDRLEARLSQLEDRLSRLVSDLSELSSHASQTNRALTQYKDKIGEMERNIATYSKSMRELAKVRKNLGALSQATVSYIVKSGDSLDRIARAHSTTAQKLKELNHLKTDKIVVGQELSVPVK
ncbi:MAG: LysM peptidoglycan-binding domain-containing protein [Simkaniaceae bacterium]|nr:LysM peptidoglycan-binding domain-containing protein [Simkaniaceae bacterium]